MRPPHRRPRRLRMAGRCAVVSLVIASAVACSTTIGGSAELGPSAPTAATSSTLATSGSSTGSGGGATADSSSTPDTDQITVPSTAGDTTTFSATSTGTSSTSTAPSSETTASEAVPPGLAKFYDQSLDWQSNCGSYSDSADDTRYYAITGLQCARLTVPLSYADPAGATITIGVLRKRATGTSRVGSVVFDPGGPGASGMSIVAQVVYAQLATSLNQSFDLVGFDPRGVGASQPAVRCRTDADWDAERAKDPRSRTAAEVAADNALQKTIADDCLTRTGGAGISGKTFLANVGTINVAKDLDVLRAALGDQKLTYVGWSYGTQIGYTYAEQFPKNVRAMILDGVVDPDQGTDAKQLGQAKGFQDAFNAFAAWCAARGNCPLGTDASKATSVYQSLTRPLLDKELPLADGRVLSYGDAVSGTLQALYANELWPELEQDLTMLQQGQGAGLMTLADEYYGRDSSGHYSPESDAFDAVRCVDSPADTDPTSVTKLDAEFDQAAPFTDSGDPPAALEDICAYWPVPVTGKLHKLDIPQLSAKILVISTTGDPATPYQGGVNVANELHAALLTVNGSRHTAYLLQDVACADTVGNAYLENLTTPAAGTTCS